MTERSEGDRWFHIEQERKRERARWQRRATARARARTMAQQAQNNLQACRGIQMEHTGWSFDEHGNLSRSVYAK